MCVGYLTLSLSVKILCCLLTFLFKTFTVKMLGQNFTLFFHYNGVLHYSTKKVKYIGGKVKVYDNMDSDCFLVPEVKHYCAELGVLDYV